MPFADLGDMGPKHGEAASFNWKWQYSVPGWIIWFVLIAVLVVPRENHNIQVLLIFVPLVVVNLLWWILMQCVNMDSNDELQFGIVFNSMALGVTVLWLKLKSYAKFGGAVRFLLSFITIMLVAGLGTLAYAIEFTTEMTLFLVLFAFMTLTILIAMALSGKVTGKTYRPVRFMLWLALWMFLIGIVAMAGFFVVGSPVFLSGRSIKEAILLISIAGLVVGLSLYILNLPYLILGFISPFFRERFLSCLGLEILPDPVGSDSTDGSVERD